MYLYAQRTESSLEPVVDFFFYPGIDVHRSLPHVECPCEDEDAESAAGDDGRDTRLTRID